MCRLGVEWPVVADLVPPPNVGFGIPLRPDLALARNLPGWPLT